MALPVIDNLAQAHPDSRIEIWCGRHSRQVFAHHPQVDAIVDVPDIPTWHDLPGLASTLRRSENDGFFILDRSRLIAAACRLAGVTVYGTVRNDAGCQAHETDRYLGTLQQASIPVQTRIPALPTVPIDSEASRELIQNLQREFVTIHPGGAKNPGALMPSKRWPLERWRAVTEWLGARSIVSVLTGSPDERDLCAKIAAGSGTRIAAGRLSLLESTGLAARGIAYVGPDTGLSHLVAATGTPTIVIFGPTNPGQYAPRGANVIVLAASGSHDVSDTDLRKPAGAAGPSTSEVTVDQVTSALDDIISRSKQP